MDGGGRLLRSLGDAGLGVFPDAPPRFAGAFAGWATPRSAPVAARSRRPARTRGTGARRVPQGAGTALLLVLFAATGLLGAVRGGQYQAFVAEYGSPADVLAKSLGFSIRSVAITGLKELTPAEILEGGDVTSRNSLALLDPAAVRDRLRAIPLIKDATVRKLFPHELTIAVVEREPVALWQKDGLLSLIAADGVPIDAVRDGRFNTLPFVVGEGANAHFAEFQALLEAAGDLRDRIRAGIRVGDRRWTLKMESGVQVDLPELQADAALRRLAQVEHQSRILEKDLISIDLRIPGRITVRLSEDAAAARAEALAKRSKKVNPA